MTLLGMYIHLRINMYLRKRLLENSYVHMYVCKIKSVFTSVILVSRLPVNNKVKPKGYE
jgi:hypothetical protein